ncbi:hypothetical protein WK66_20085 [Burkholderia ubonensis]|nr:hypothetical protein WK66_20085 [Burkholderia ubonensis]
MRRPRRPRPSLRHRCPPPRGRERDDARGRQPATPAAPYTITHPNPCTSAACNAAPVGSAWTSAGASARHPSTRPAAISCASARSAASPTVPPTLAFRPDTIPATSTKPIVAMFSASEIIRALMSMPDAIPARALGTAPVVVLVTGVFVRPSPMPASRQPGSIVSQSACSAALPTRISAKPAAIVKSPPGITTPAP